MNELPQQVSPNKSSVGAVNIQIYNPTAGTNMPQYPHMQYPYMAPYPYPYMCPYPYQIPQQIPATQGLNPPAQTINPPVTPAENKPAQPPETKPAKPAEEKKSIVPLTNDYLGTLDNYLNNPNSRLRLMAIQEVLNRFKEDKNRKNDPALTGLLNKALQDPAQNVRLLALATLDAGYASGNAATIKLLKNMQHSNQAYNEDAVLASRILLERSGQKLNIESTPAQSALAQSAIGQNVNLNAV